MRKSKKAFETPITVAILMYGNNHNLHRRCLESILENVSDPREDIRLRIGLNEVCPGTLRYLTDVFRKYRIIPELLIEHDRNQLKYPVMRELIYKKQVTTKWFVWFDDDSHVTDSLWLPRLAEDIDREYGNGARLFGKLYTWDLLYGQSVWYKQASWWRDKPLTVAQRGSKQVYRVLFPTGGYWAIDYDVLLDLFWPDERLTHNGGDVALGEAVRQLGYKVASSHEHVAVNDGSRRGVSQLPAGALSKTREIVK